MIAGFPQLASAEEAHRAGRHEQAARHLLAHLRQHPQEPRGLALLGSVAMSSGALVQAEMFLRRSLAGQPGNSEVLRSLASCLNQQERLDEALLAFEPLRNPDDPALEVTISLILDKLGRLDEARTILERALETNSGRPNIWIALGHNLRSAGQTKEAVGAYRRAIAIEPELGDAWWGIANIKQRLLTDDDVAAMRAALTTAVDANNIAPLHFALARAHHDRGEFEHAFRHYAEANRLWAESLNYDPDQLTEEVTESSRLFGPDFFARSPAGGDPSSAPIFIVSLPRSGSTLLEQMLDRHPAIEALGELSYIPALLRSAMEAATRSGIRSVPEAIARLAPADRTALGREYLRRAALHRTSGAPHFIDKMPHNWSNLLFIRQILPNARIVDIRRDAMTCCWSNFSHSFSRAHASSFTLEGMGRAYRDYVRFMDFIDAALPGYVQRVDYQGLVEQPETPLRSLLGYLGLPWDDAILRFHESSRNVRTPSAEQVRRPLNREGLDTWRPYEQWLGPLKIELGSLAND